MENDATARLTSSSEEDHNHEHPQPGPSEAAALDADPSRGRMARVLAVLIFSCGALVLAASLRRGDTGRGYHFVGHGEPLLGAWRQPLGQPFQPLGQPFNARGLYDNLDDSSNATNTSDNQKGLSYSSDNSSNATNASNTSRKLKKPPRPTPAPTPAPGPCLCVFDLDRTLTARQGSADKCVGAKEVGGVEDPAFFGGTMVLSELGARSIEDTFCNDCYIGVVTAGGVDASSEHAAKILDAIGGYEHSLTGFWQDANFKEVKEGIEVVSSLVFHAVEKKKQDYIWSMLSWFWNSHNIDIKSWEVHFFDDDLGNVEPFKDSGFNARQISCASRGPTEQWNQADGEFGACGAKLGEIVKEKGVSTCEGISERPPCLCVFDVDRTLTGRQGWAEKCEGTKRINKTDPAYQHGKLVLSQLATHMDDTFCWKCYRGIITDNNIKGDGVDLDIVEAVGTEHTRSTFWSEASWEASPEITSSLVIHAVEGKRHDAIRSMLSWWWTSQKVKFADENVYYFDDDFKNVAAFKNSGFNARQVSCASRDEGYDGRIGACGATSDEIVDEKGVKTCEGMEETRSCLCVFDVERTLTGKLGWAGQCPGTKEMTWPERSVWDKSYMPDGPMILSEVSVRIEDTFCRKCFRGVVTHGDFNEPESAARKEIVNVLGGTDKLRSKVWQDVKWKRDAEVTSSLVFHAVDGAKQDTVRSMLSWWKKAHNIGINEEDVHFFDDTFENIAPFEGSGFNAHQISCSSRGPAELWDNDYDGKTGGCGANVTEIIEKKGVTTCTEGPSCQTWCATLWDHDWNEKCIWNNCVSCGECCSGDYC